MSVPLGRPETEGVVSGAPASIHFFPGGGWHPNDHTHCTPFLGQSPAHEGLVHAQFSNLEGLFPYPLSLKPSTLEA